MILIKYYAFVLIFVCTRVFGIQANAYVDKNKCSTEDLINFKIELENVNSFDTVDISKLSENFDVINGPSSQTSMQWINGKVTNTKTISWHIMPNKTGRLTIPILSFEIEGKIYTTNAITILVNEPQSEKDFFLVSKISQEDAYIGQPIILTYKLYRKVECSVESFKLPDYEGFWSEDLFRPKKIKFKNIEIDGVQYQEGIVYKAALFPLSNTELEIEPLSIKIQIHKNDKNTANDPYFDPFFDRTETKLLKSQKLKISTKDYPKPIPSHYSGAVGKFSLSNEISRNELEVNEEFYVKFTINGFGNIGQFPFPKIDLPKYLEPIRVKEDIKKEIINDKVKGEKTYKIYVRAKKSGNYSIPLTFLSYFDPVDEIWHEVSTNHLNFKVKGVSISGNTSSHRRGIKNDHSDIYLIALDISSSMLANDFPPSRLNVIKDKLKYFFKQLTGEKIGIISFSGFTTVESAITKNYYLLNYILNDISVSSKAKDGTAIGLAIGQSISHANQFLTKNKEIILITDGSNNSGNIDPITGARLAKENNIKIHTIAVGSDNSIVRISGRGMISNDIDTETLKKISKITNGEFLGRNPKIKLNWLSKNY